MPGAHPVGVHSMSETDRAERQRLRDSSLPYTPVLTSVTLEASEQPLNALIILQIEDLPNTTRTVIGRRKHMVSTNAPSVPLDNG
jgi:uncharacterized protein YlzI (FlbEa/FlbD family)